MICVICLGVFCDDPTQYDGCHKLDSPWRLRIRLEEKLMGVFFHQPINQAILKKVLFEGEYRARFERRLDKDFNSSRDNRTDLMHRFRVSAKVGNKEGWSALVQYQFAFDKFWAQPKDGSDESSDVLQLYAQHNRNGQKVTLGRQRISVGSERLIGTLDWVNRSRSYDGVRFQNKNLDIFGVIVGVQNARPKKARLLGISFNRNGQTTSIIQKHDENPAKVDITTLAQSYQLSNSGIDFDGDAAVQFGKNGSVDQEAWALHLGASRKISPKDKLSLEVNMASGGSTSTKNRTFDNLYPTNHKFFGLLDMFAWKNMTQVAIALNHKVRNGHDLKFRASKNWLRDSKDAWYGAGGAANPRAGGTMKDPTGAAGRDLGYEFDAEYTWLVSPKATISAGIGVYAPGNFVRNLTGERRTQKFGYLQYLLKF